MVGGACGGGDDVKIVICKCQACKHGRKYIHRREVEDKAQGAKARVRQLLRKGEYDKLPQTVAIGYTD